MTRVLLAIALVTFAVLGCYEDEPASVSDTGVIVFLSLEGGFFGIVDDHDRHWDPTNLPEQFRVDSLRVQFEGIITDRPTFHMWGRTVELISIRRLK